MMTWLPWWRTLKRPMWDSEPYGQLIAACILIAGLCLFIGGVQESFISVTALGAWLCWFGMGR